jgi:hypothetical protein
MVARCSRTSAHLLVTRFRLVAFSATHGRLFDIGQERGNWPQMQLVLQSWGPQCGN